jgi:hypothetical protein
VVCLDGDDDEEEEYDEAEEEKVGSAAAVLPLRLRLLPAVVASSRLLPKSSKEESTDAVDTFSRPILAATMLVERRTRPLTKVDGRHRDASISVSATRSAVRFKKDYGITGQLPNVGNLSKCESRVEVATTSKERSFLTQ